MRIISSTSSHTQPLQKVISTCSKGQKVYLSFCEKTKNVVAFLIDRNTGRTEFKPENTPREFRLIKSSIQFQGFVKDAFAKVSTLSDGAMRLQIQQRGRGGGGSNEDPQFADELDLVSAVLGLWEKGKEVIRSLKVKENGIPIMGRTGAGKSMLANLLAEVPLKGVRVRMEFRFEAENPIFPISHSNTESCTSLPTVFSPPQKNYTYIDLAGFDDIGRNPVQDIVNLFFREEILRSVERMKMILVVDWTDINRRGSYLTNTFNDFLQYLGLSDVTDDRLGRLAQSLVLVVTHTPPLDNLIVKEEVVEALKDYLISPNGLTHNAKAILRKVIEDERWSTFSSPAQAGTSPKASEERAKIAALLLDTKTQYYPKSDATIQSKVSAKHEGKVQSGLLALIGSIRKQLGNPIVNELTLYLKKFYKGVEGEKALSKFQKKFHAAIVSEEPRSIFGLLKSLQFNSSIFSTGLLEHARKLDENLEFLINLLPDKLACQFPSSRDWLKELEIRKPLEALDAALSKMTAAATLRSITLPSKKIRLVLEGYFPRVSQITNEIHKYNDIEAIEIHALHTVHIDEDLSGDKLQGVDVTIIAPKWAITNKRTINLTGKNGNIPYTRRARDGDTPGAAGYDGQPGIAGGNGGNFFGFGLVFSGIERLYVKSKGGSGGPGQPGGAGQAGNEGEDGRVKNDFTKKNKKAHSADFAARSGWDYVQIPPFSHGNDTYDQDLRNNGQPGQIGGNGGRGGIGGHGGHSGLIEFVSLHDPDCKITSELGEGDAGKDGDAGAPGMGGRRGRHWGGLWHSGKHGSTWNGHAANLPKFHPQTRAECERAASGTEPQDKNSLGGSSREPSRPAVLLERLYRYREFAIRESIPLTIEAIEIFRQFYEKHPKILEKASVDNFIAECDRMEDFFAEAADKTLCLPLYRWMAERIQAFKVPGGSAADIALMQCLYTCTLSKIFQLNAALQSRLIINIKGFLKRAESNVALLKQSDHAVKVSFYEQEYVGQLTSKMKEADIFIKKLQDDIRSADKEIDLAIKKLVKEIDQFQSKNAENKVDIKKKRKELQALISKRRTLGIINVAVQAIGCCFPPAGPIVAGVVGVGLTMMSNSPRGRRSSSSSPACLYRRNF